MNYEPPVVSLSFAQPDTLKMHTTPRTSSFFEVATNDSINHNIL